MSNNSREKPSAWKTNVWWSNLRITSAYISWTSSIKRDNLVLLGVFLHSNGCFWVTDIKLNTSEDSWVKKVASSRYFFGTGFLLSRRDDEFEQNTCKIPHPPLFIECSLAPWGWPYCSYESHIWPLPGEKGAWCFQVRTTRHLSPEMLGAKEIILLSDLGCNTCGPLRGQ